MPELTSADLLHQITDLLTEGEQVLRGRHDAPRSGGIGATAAERTDRGFRVETAQAKAGEPPSQPVNTVIYIYSDIGGWFGVWPEEIIAELAPLTGNVELHLHSPGGDAFDGIAIYNAFRTHNDDETKGQVDVVVDGLAASAASVIAMSGQTVKMRKGAQMMIHDAWGYAVGPAEDMAKMTTFLDKISNSIAGIYAARAGGTDEDWRTAMQEESWYTDREAVEAGLADTMETDTAASKNHWDLRVFAHAGRDHAPAPAMPAGRRYDAVEVAGRSDPIRMVSTTPETPAQAAARMHAAAQRAADKTPATTTVTGPSHTEGGSNMPFDPVKIREALGLGPTATDAEVAAAWAAGFSVTPAPTPPADPPGTPTPPAPPTPTPAPPGGENLSKLAQMAKDMGVTLIDPSQLAKMQAMAAQGAEAYKQQRAGERDMEIEKALKAGKIELARQDHWKAKWEADPEGTRETLNALAPNMVPMEASGYAGTVAANEAESRYFELYPEDKPQGGVRRG